MKNGINEIISDLNDLGGRLVKDYNNIKKFEQYEEDRLLVYDTMDMLFTLKTFIEMELSTYPCNETLETMLSIMNLETTMDDLKEKYYFQTIIEGSNDDEETN